MKHKKPELTLKNSSINAADEINSEKLSKPPNFSPSSSGIQLKSEKNQSKASQMRINPLQMKGEEEEESMQMKINPFQLKGEEEEESMQMKANPLQMKGEEEEESMQMKIGPFQMKGEEEEESLQMKKSNRKAGGSSTETSTKTTLPENVQLKMESAFDTDFSGVNIKSNSNKAEGLGAQAYAQGNDVHFAPGKYDPQSQSGQELIGHELSHVVQQREGRVSSTAQMKGVSVNDDVSLENEADQMGKKAANNEKATSPTTAKSKSTVTTNPIQKKGKAAKAKINAAHAAKLHEAMDGLGTDEAAIFSVLGSLSTGQVKGVKKLYSQNYGISLIAELRDELSNELFASALRMLGCWPVLTDDILGSYQADLANQKILAMSGADVDKLSHLIDIQKGAQHRAYVFKALAANNSLDQIDTFARRIKGKSKKWLQNHLRLTRQTNGRGIKQQWNDSCGPTTAQAVQGELDPIYALRTRDNNTNITRSSSSDPSGYNENLALDQKNLLEWGGGTAVARGGSGGNGMSMTDEMTIIESRTGIDYSVVWASDKEASMTRIDQILATGIPVPIRVGGSGGHFVLITNKTGNSYNIHDVWDGRSFTRTKSNFVNNTMNIAGWPNFTHYGNP